VTDRTPQRTPRDNTHNAVSTVFGLSLTQQLLDLAGELGLEAENVVL